MATIDLTITNTTGANQGYLPDRAYQLWEGPDFRTRRRVFFVGQPDWGGLTPTAADILRTNPISQGDYIISAFLSVITAGPAGSTISIGDTGSATQYINGFTAATAGVCFAPVSTAKFYANSDYLLATMGATVPTGALVSVGYIGIPVVQFTNL